MTWFGGSQRALRALAPGPKQRPEARAEWRFLILAENHVRHRYRRIQSNTEIHVNPAIGLEHTDYRK